MNPQRLKAKAVVIYRSGRIEIPLGISGINAIGAVKAYRERAAAPKLIVYGAVLGRELVGLGADFRVAASVSRAQRVRPRLGIRITWTNFGGEPA